MSVNVVISQILIFYLNLGFLNLAPTPWQRSNSEGL